jgi:hypothetical protein
MAEDDARSFLSLAMLCGNKSAHRKESANWGRRGPSVGSLLLQEHHFKINQLEIDFLWKLLS